MSLLVYLTIIHYDDDDDVHDDNDNMTTVKTITINK